MAKNKIKELLSITMIIFSLFLFASPTIDTSFFDAGSEKVLDLDLENETEQENDVEGKNVFSLIKHFSFYSLCAYNLKLAYTLHSHSYYNNSSLFKPPILHS